MAPRGTQAMLEFPRWKYVVIVIVLALSALYALPNIYQKDPAIQITANRGGLVDSALRDRVLADLKQAGVTPMAAEVEGDSLIVRLPDIQAQTAANDVLKQSVGEDYVVALNLASTTPEWLSNIGAKPMKLGLDLRGGVHFKLEVDVAKAQAIGDTLRARSDVAKVDLVTPQQPKTQVVDPAAREVFEVHSVLAIERQDDVARHRAGGVKPQACVAGLAEVGMKDVADGRTVRIEAVVGKTVPGRALHQLPWAMGCHPLSPV